MAGLEWLYEAAEVPLSLSLEPLPDFKLAMDEPVTPDCGSKALLASPDFNTLLSLADRSKLHALEARAPPPFTGDPDDTHRLRSYSQEKQLFLQSLSSEAAETVRLLWSMQKSEVKQKKRSSKQNVSKRQIDKTIDNRPQTLSDRGCNCKASFKETG